MRYFFQLIKQDAPIRKAWRRVIYLWKPMAGWTLLVWAAMAVILAPLSSALLGLQVFRGDKLVIGNEQLFSWLFSPEGVGYVLLGSSLVLTGWIVRFAGLFQIVSDNMDGKEVGIQNIAPGIIRSLPVLFRLCLFTVAAALILLLPLVAGLGLTYELLLGAYDINYYLSVNPAEWHLAVVIGGVWTLGWLVGVIYIISRCLLALPAYLKSRKSIKESIIHAWKLGQSRTQNIFPVIFLSIGFWLLVGFVAGAIFFAVFAGLISWISDFMDSVRLIALFTGIYLAGTVLLDAIISFLGFSHISTLVTMLYYDDSGRPTEVPPARNKFKKLASAAKSLFLPRRLLPVAGVLVLVSVIISGYMLEQVPQPETENTVKIAAHRAGPPPAPENTLEALEHSIQAGAEYAEIDVQLTRDNVIVVAHDADLMRMSGDPSRIAATGYDTLQAILERQYSGNPNRKQRINTLDEFLDATRDHIRLLIELKHPGAELVERVVATVRQRSMQNDVVIMSMNLDAVRQVRKSAPEIATGYVSAFSLGNLSRLPVQLLAINHRLISSQLIEEAQQRDMEVYAWTVNRAAQMANMIERGVDGIITDDPELAIRVRNEMQELTTAERLLLQFQQFVVE